jgi:hypothetical protein
MGKINVFLKNLFGLNKVNQVKREDQVEVTVEVDVPEKKDIPVEKIKGLIKLGEVDICPYCKKKLNKIPGRKKKCDFCEKYIYVRTRPIDRKKVLVTEKQKDDIEEQWIIYNAAQEENQFSGDNDYLKAKEELRKRFGKNPSLNDVKWSLCNKRILEYASKKQWGLYRNNKFEMATLLEKEQKYKQALGLLFEVCYLDLNGCRNVGTINGNSLSDEYLKELGVKEFDPKMAFLAPGVISMIKDLIEKINLSNDEIEKLFIDVNNRTKPKKNIPLTPKEAFDKFVGELKK